MIKYCKLKHIFSQFQLAFNVAPHEVSIITTTKHPVGSSPQSNTLNISTQQFSPFTFFCHFDTHVRGARLVFLVCTMGLQYFQTSGRLYSRKRKRTRFRQTKNFFDTWKGIPLSRVQVFLIFFEIVTVHLSKFLVWFYFLQYF